jgi:hypothetical protein
VTTVLLAIGMMALLMTIMAVGVMMGRPELKGSCGGVGGADCQCSSPGESCERRQRADEREELVEIEVRG